mgnify:CR=1 FL=1
MSELLVDINKLRKAVYTLSDPFRTQADALSSTKELLQQMLDVKVNDLRELENQYD